MARRRFIFLATSGAARRRIPAGLAIVFGGCLLRGYWASQNGGYRLIAVAGYLGYNTIANIKDNLISDLKPITDSLKKQSDSLHRKFDDL